MLTSCEVRTQNLYDRLYSKVSWNIKNIFFSPADFTSSAFMCEESKTPIARL